MLNQFSDKLSSATSGAGHYAKNPYVIGFAALTAALTIFSQPETAVELGANIALSALYSGAATAGTYAISNSKSIVSYFKSQAAGPIGVDAQDNAAPAPVQATRSSSRRNKYKGSFKGMC